MKLLIQPDDGITPSVKGINGAKSSIDIVIFRLDREEIERALAEAVSRGVSVRALVAHANRSGEDGLRKLELRLLGRGVVVARTSDDLVRYHGKFMIVDRRELHLFAFNFTYLDMERSRSFGLITTDRALVQEAIKLFEADTRRAPYEPGDPAFVVSPVNARKQLAAFISGAKSELLIYDPAVSDPAVVRLLDERAKAGVNVRIIGKLLHKNPRIAARSLNHLRLHTRTMIRDGLDGFVGSQSLKGAELDARREVGVIFRDAKTVSQIAKVFADDWNLAEREAKDQAKEDADAAAKVAKKIAKAVAKELPPVTPVVEQAIHKMTGGESKEGEAMLSESRETLEETVKDAVREAVQQAVEDIVESVVEERK